MHENPGELALLIQSSFPSEPVPNYPPMMGIDPMGIDEYAEFAGLPWPDVPPELYGGLMGYDISPVIGFASFPTPEMWNYHLPGFMTASLLHEEESELLTNSLIETMRDAEPRTKNVADLSVPWWAGNEYNENYSVEQCETVVFYLEYVCKLGSKKTYCHVWRAKDEKTLANWYRLIR